MSAIHPRTRDLCVWAHPSPGAVCLLAGFWQWVEGGKEEGEWGLDGEGERRERQRVKVCAARS